MKRQKERPTMAKRSDKLTEPQREALRYVAQGYESKEIAQRTGVTHHAIDKRIERGVRAMGLTERREAARLLAQEEELTYERTAYEPSDLGIPASDAIVPASDRVGVPGYPWPWLVTRQGRLLTKRERLLWALFGLPLLIMFVWGIFLAGINALDGLKL
jgi:DNA-binding CsgD family transcriptional regulator